MKRVKVLGLGNFGFALLYHLDKTTDGIRLTGFTRNSSLLSDLSNSRIHPLFPSASPLSQRVVFEPDLETFIHDTDILIVAITSNAIGAVLKKIKQYINSPILFINTAKALDHETGKPYSAIIREILLDMPHTYAHLAGATLAKDIVAGVPLGINLASSSTTDLHDLTRLFASKNLRIVPTTDVAGVEYASAFKNVVSIFSGIMQGAGYVTESMIYAVTQLAYEVEKLVVEEYGAKRETFSLSSPCWGNDLWMSCTSVTRNRELGIQIGKKGSVKDVLSELELQKKTVEGVYTIQVLDKIALLTRYPLLEFLFEFFRGKSSLSHIETLLQNTR